MMQSLSGSFEQSGKPSDAWHKISLPERKPSDCWRSPDKEDGVSPLSTGVTSPGLISLSTVESTEKETYLQNFAEAPEVVPQTPLPPRQVKRRKWRYWILALVICIVVGLAVGLGVGLTRERSDDNSTDPIDAASIPASPTPGSNAFDPAYLSTIGAFNGSGLALASQSFDSGGHGSIVLYFQHHTGQIRATQLDDDGTWKGGDITEIVAVDAKNATPISAVAYARNETAAWHIFYINTDNRITEVINDNMTNVWRPGPINKLNLQAMDDRNVGLQACWYGGFYSDAAYNHSPIQGAPDTPTNTSDQTVGIHLWYARNATSFESVGWTHRDTAWAPQEIFDGYNGHAGVGCYSWGPGSNVYVMFVNLQDEINILWKDLNTTKDGNETHPINTWTKSSVAIPVFQNTSMGYTNYLYAQSPDLSLSGYNVSWAAEDTSIPAEQTFVINGARGLPGTHLTLTALPDPSGGDSLLVFYQTNGTDVTEFVRDLEGGQWTSFSVPVPDD